MSGNHTLQFLLKVLVVSVILSVCIKQGGPYLPIQASTSGVLVAVFLPSIVLAAILVWRSNHTH